MADAATMTIKAVLLPDEMQATLKDLTFSYTPANNSEKWFYGLINVRNAVGNLIAGNFLAHWDGTASASATADIATTDKVKFLFIRNLANTGASNGGSTTDESVLLTFDGENPSHTATNVLEIGTGESWSCKPTNTTVDDIKSITVDSASGVLSAGDGDVQCLVAAIIDDI